MSFVDFTFLIPLCILSVVISCCTPCAQAVVEPDPSKFILYGPGIEKPDLVLPARYFYIQAVDKHGRNITEDLGDDYLKIRFGGDTAEGKPCELRFDHVNRHDGSYVVRYRLFESCIYVAIELKTKDGQSLLQNSYIILERKDAQLLMHDECYCPTTDVRSWLKHMDCPSDYKQLKKDLKQWPPNSVNFSDVLLEAKERFFKYENNYLVCHFKIKENQIYRKCSGNYQKFKVYIEAMLLSLARKIWLPDTEFIFNLADWPLETKEKHENPIPVLGWSCSKASWDIALPTYEITARTMEILGKVQIVCGPQQAPDMLEVERHNRIPWQQKVDKAFWRGRDSRRERLRLVELSREHPELLDAAITMFHRYADEANVYGPTAERVPFEEFFKYRYTLNVDGMVAAYRFPNLLAGNSLVLKQDSPYYEHFYAELKPFEHFVPVERDLSDLISKIQWAIDHQEKAREIVQNAIHYTRNRLQPKDIYCYYAVALMKYAKLLNSTVEDVDPLLLEHVPQPTQTCQCKEPSQANVKDEF